MSTSIREIARRTGLSIAAVSQALRGVGRLAAPTRARVLKTAKEMGYQRDPLLSQAFSRARQPRDKRYRETLALILEWKTETGPEYQKKIHAAAAEQAASMGYILEPFIVSNKATEHRHLSRILRARGIRGLIINPRLGSRQPRLHMEWQHFAPVEIGRTLWHPRNLHRVEPGDYHQSLEALHILKKVGYRRIGMAVEPIHNNQQHGVYYAAFLLSQLRQPQSERLPIFAQTSPFDERSFRDWVSLNEPDVLFIHRVNTISGWLKDLRLRVPEDISLFCVNVPSSHWSGLRRDYEGIGRAAVEMVSLLLQGDRLGLPGNPRCLQIDEFWQPGETLSRPIADYISAEGYLRAGSWRLPRAAGSSALPG